MQRAGQLHSLHRCTGPRCAAAAPPAAAACWRALTRGRRAAVEIQCKQRAAAGRRQSKSKGTASTRKGFAKPDARALAEPWEADLPPYYRVYYKPGFKPPRFVGQIELKKQQDGTVDVTCMQSLVPSQLLACIPALVFLEGSFGAAPDVEQLHAALLAGGDQTPAAIARVLHLLPRAAEEQLPDAKAAGSFQAASPGGGLEPAAAAMDLPPSGDHQDGSAAAAVDAKVVVPSPLAAAADVFDLDPKNWSARAARRALPPNAPPPTLPESSDLMRILQASSYGEDYLDPATSQLRHEKPLGFIGVWPEVAAMRHSCAPNTSLAVVGGGFALVHAARELGQGEALTTNKIGGAILAPLAVRQAAVRALTGRGCDCWRCQLERKLPVGLAEQLADLHARMESEWPEALNEAAQAGDEEALQALWEDVTLDVDAFHEALHALSLGDDESDALAAGAYAAADLAWSLEELTQQEPKVDRLAAAVRMLRAVAPGSESHVAVSLQLHGLVTARVTELLKGERAGKRRTAAAEKRLLAKVVEYDKEAESALIAFYEAMYVRYGFISDEGLLPQLQNGLELFYAGLDQLSAQAAAGGTPGRAPDRELIVDGIPVTVVDRVGISYGGDASSSKPDFELSSGGAAAEVVKGNVRLRVVPVEDSEVGGSHDLAVAGGLAFGDDGASGREGEGVVNVLGGAAVVGEGSLHEDGPLLGDGLEEGAPESILTP